MGEPSSRSEVVEYRSLSTDYNLFQEIGTSSVYRTRCLYNGTEVAVKLKDITEDDSKSENSNILEKMIKDRGSYPTLSHPNILTPHCIFTVEVDGRVPRRWTILPYMSAGSLHSVLSSAFPNGMPEKCIAIILRQILQGLKYLHAEVRHLLEGKILMDLQGSVKLAVAGGTFIPESSDFSHPNYTNKPRPYWVAPEAIRSSRYDSQADIWSFGVIALELAHGGPPLSAIPESPSLCNQIRNRFNLPELGNGVVKNRRKEFTKKFKKIVGRCLKEDPTKRPSAEDLLNKSFFKKCKGVNFLENRLKKIGLDNVEKRVHVDVVDDDGDGSAAFPPDVWSYNDAGFVLQMGAGTG